MTALYAATLAMALVWLAIECADKDGLTTIEPLTGPWDKRADLRKRSERRIGDAAPLGSVRSDAVAGLLRAGRAAL